MDERIKEAFEQVQAESGLKDRTKAYVSRKTGGYRRKGTAKYKVLASAFACVALLLFGGYWLYFTPTVEISIDEMCIRDRTLISTAPQKSCLAAGS